MFAGLRTRAALRAACDGFHDDLATDHALADDQSSVAGGRVGGVCAEPDDLLMNRNCDSRV
jgi:hypothetical protein